MFNLKDMFSPLVALDVGGANSVVGVLGRGNALRCPSAVMAVKADGRVLSVGEEAWMTLERTPGNIVSQRPFAICRAADAALTTATAAHLLRQADNPIDVAAEGLLEIAASGRAREVSE